MKQVNSLLDEIFIEMVKDLDPQAPMDNARLIQKRLRGIYRALEWRSNGLGVYARSYLEDVARKSDLIP